MRCNVCGREAKNPEANFCDYCGSSFRENAATYHTVQEDARASGNRTGGYTPFGTMNSYAPEDAKDGQRMEGVAKDRQEKPITIWTYLGPMLLIFTPYVGFYAFLGILLYWSFAAGISPERKTFARALLIFSGVILVFAAIGMSMMMNSGMLDSLLGQMGITK